MLAFNEHKLADLTFAVTVVAQVLAAHIAGMRQVRLYQLCTHTRNHTNFEIAGQNPVESTHAFWLPRRLTAFANCSAGEAVLRCGMWLTRSLNEPLTKWMSRPRLARSWNLPQ
ncbi:hypothetical protein D3C76_1480780 [compost metagenome]